MSTVAFDGVTVAADRGGWMGGTYGTTKKLFFVDVRGRGAHAIGTVGTPSFSQAAVRALEQGVDLPDVVKYDSDAPTFMWGLAVKIGVRRKGFFFLHTSGEWVFQGDVQGALGTGSEFALGAMMAGASAGRAVRLTERRTNFAALGVDTIKVRT